MNQRVVWGNENPPGPNMDEHHSECRCINCSINKEERDE